MIRSDAATTAVIHTPDATSADHNRTSTSSAAVVAARRARTLKAALQSSRSTASTSSSASESGAPLSPPSFIKQPSSSTTNISSSNSNQVSTSPLNEAAFMPIAAAPTAAHISVSIQRGTSSTAISPSSSSLPVLNHRAPSRVSTPPVEGSNNNNKNSAHRPVGFVQSNPPSTIDLSRHEAVSVSPASHQPALDSSVVNRPAMRHSNKLTMLNDSPNNDATNNDKNSGASIAAHDGIDATYQIDRDATSSSRTSSGGAGGTTLDRRSSNSSGLDHELDYDEAEGAGRNGHMRGRWDAPALTDNNQRSVSQSLDGSSVLEAEGVERNSGLCSVDSPGAAAAGGVIGSGGLSSGNSRLPAKDLAGLSDGSGGSDSTTAKVEDEDETEEEKYSPTRRRERLPPIPFGVVDNPAGVGINIGLGGDLIVGADILEWELPTPSKFLKLRERLVKFMETRQLKQADICRFTGLAAPYLSFVLKVPHITSFSSRRQVEVYSLIKNLLDRVDSGDISEDTLHNAVSVSRVFSKGGGGNGTNSARLFGSTTSRKRGALSAINDYTNASNGVGSSGGLESDRGKRTRPKTSKVLKNEDLMLNYAYDGFAAEGFGEADVTNGYEDMWRPLDEQRTNYLKRASDDGMSDSRAIEYTHDLADGREGAGPRRGRPRGSRGGRLGRPPSMHRRAGRVSRGTGRGRRLLPRVDSFGSASESRGQLDIENGYEAGGSGTYFSGNCGGYFDYNNNDGGLHGIMDGSTVSGMARPLLTVSSSDGESHHSQFSGNHNDAWPAYGGDSSCIRQMDTAALTASLSNRINNTSSNGARMPHLSKFYEQRPTDPIGATIDGVADTRQSKGVDHNSLLRAALEAEGGEEATAAILQLFLDCTTDGTELDSSSLVNTNNGKVNATVNTPHTTGGTLEDNNGDHQSGGSGDTSRPGAEESVKGEKTEADKCKPLRLLLQQRRGGWSGEADGNGRSHGGEITALRDVSSVLFGVGLQKELDLQGDDDDICDLPCGLGSKDYSNESGWFPNMKSGRMCVITLSWSHNMRTGDEDILWDLAERDRSVESFVSAFCIDHRLPMRVVGQSLLLSFRKQLAAARRFEGLFDIVCEELMEKLGHSSRKYLPGITRKIVLDCLHQDVRVVDLVPWNLSNSLTEVNRFLQSMIFDCNLPASFMSTLLPAFVRAVAREKLRFVHECGRFLLGDIRNEIQACQSQQRDRKRTLKAVAKSSSTASLAFVDPSSPPHISNANTTHLLSEGTGALSGRAGFSSLQLPSALGLTVPSMIASDVATGPSAPKRRVLDVENSSSTSRIGWRRSSSDHTGPLAGGSPTAVAQSNLASNFLEAARRGPSAESVGASDKGRLDTFSRDNSSQDALVNSVAVGGLGEVTQGASGVGVDSSSRVVATVGRRDGNQQTLSQNGSSSLTIPENKIEVSNGDNGDIQSSSTSSGEIDNVGLQFPLRLTGMFSDQIKVAADGNSNSSGSRSYHNIEASGSNSNSRQEGIGLRGQNQDALNANSGRVEHELLDELGVPSTPYVLRPGSVIGGDALSLSEALRAHASALLGSGLAEPGDGESTNRKSRSSQRAAQASEQQLEELVGLAGRHPSVCV